MAITTENNRTAELVTDGSETDFDFGMLIKKGDWLEVYFKATGGSYAQLVLNTDYGVVFTEYGGTVSTSGFTAPLVAGEILIIRHPPGTMQANYLYLDNHSEVQHQDDFDHGASRYLYLLDLIARCPQFAIHSSTTGIRFPEPVANQFIGWDGAGTDLENKTPGTGGGSEVVNFDDLEDVDVDDPTIGDMVQWDGSSWKKVSNISVASIELVKPGNVPGSNGNSRRRIVGDYEIFERRTAGAWVTTGRRVRIA